MEITGKIIANAGERSGVSSRNGNEWKVVTYVLETQDNYPRRMAFEVFGVDRIAQFNIQVGEVLNVSFDVDAREYNGRWYNTIRAFRVDRNVAPQGAPIPPMGAEMNAPFASAAPAAQGAPLPQTAPAPAPQSSDAPFPPMGGESDLPF